jgi:GNAT superfamily N-acetyltransferase
MSPKEYGSKDLYDAAEFFRNIGKTVIVYEVLEDKQMIGGVLIINNNITALFVHEQWRKCGIGSSLIKTMQRSHQSLTLQCGKDLLPFYDKFGFKQTDYEEGSKIYHMSWTKTK